MTDVRRPSKMSQQRWGDIRKEELTDISQIHLDENLSPEQKNVFLFGTGRKPLLLFVWGDTGANLFY